MVYGSWFIIKWWRIKRRLDGEGEELNRNYVFMVKDYLELVASPRRGGKHRGELLVLRVRMTYGLWLMVDGLWLLVDGLWLTVK